ncbi:respiratory nitrate reductase gamma subunit [Paracoccus pantotrophus]|uniref:nitrate reductase (quinone) n=1 Tax=Paracoccus pantotrophus TaxID=82367 RepID=A0A1I5DM95_PARPN|nr:respiratory nitrate reductase subunit gamma [Paracoccus pantotrophus]MDF3853916.1 respiratory nitrate reductase subunit gamma [Paracoccus pantotrophus]QFG35178.1 respiratory nitrate reductase subunit gamma [Paracoccus pantotrophus]QLH13419.1 respiratory nitrate reductase subunit gamma [Paracoccus pantotrophus]RDD96757.1 respiratory nitrate reductase subunit gamma [Paracoccus pantotrophus]RKS44630.1 respiratory nitrate reductase gamma subunit [Paracoccus pantotrophus]
MNNFLFGIYPYIAITVMLLGSIIRYDQDPFSWKSKSSQILRRRQFVIGSVLFHVGVLVIFFGHLVGLLTPIAVFDALGISHGAKQVLAMTAGGIAGVMALVGGGMLLHRRLTDPRVRAHTTLADTGILALLVAQLVLGLMTILVSMQHLDGHEMTRLMSWAQGIVYFRAGAADHLVGVHWLFKLHILLGLTIFLLFPFTRLVHMISAPVRYLWRPGYQIVRTKRQPAKRHPAE